MKTTSPGIGRLVAACLPLLLAPAAHADSSDNFSGPSKNTSYWGPDDINNNGALAQGGGMLRYSCANGTDEDLAEWPAIAIRLPYNADWEMQLDCHNTSAPVAPFQVNSMGFTLESPLDDHTDVYLEFYNSALGGPARTGFNADMQVNDVQLGGGDSGGPQGNDGAIRFHWTASTELLRAYYDLDLSDGYQWVELGTFGLGAGGGGSLTNGNWGMSPTDQFFFSLYGYSSFMSVTAGQMTADNFSETGGISSGGTRPEPTGSFDFAFPTANPLLTRIASLIGNYQGISPVAPLRPYNLDVAQDESGKIMAMGTVNGVQDSSGDSDLALSLGRVRTVNEEPVAEVKSSFKGTADGMAATFKSNGTFPVELVAVTSAPISTTGTVAAGPLGVAGTATYSGKANGIPFSGKNEPLEFEAPPGSESNLVLDWSLQLDITVTQVKGKDRIMAAATLVLPDGNTVVFAGKTVKYSEAKGYNITFKKGTNVTANPDVIDPKTSIALKGLKFQRVGTDWIPNGGTITYSFLGQKGVENLLQFLAP
jgi:hypothetical protein